MLVEFNINNLLSAAGTKYLSDSVLNPRPLPNVQFRATLRKAYAIAVAWESVESKTESKKHCLIEINTYRMIISFGTKTTEKIWQGERVKKIPLEVQQTARRKLRMLNNSQNIIDLRIPPSNRLEKLKGNRKDFYSIRINNQWRIIFKWENNHSLKVEIIDYH